LKIPRDIEGGELARALTVLGYQIVRQSGSHMRLMTTKNGVHHLTIPYHSPLKVGTLLGGILKPVDAHHRLSVEEVLSALGW
jgi:predicted RNA binding protein YcfA (HicA-like mRNA interferase family)